MEKKFNFLGEDAIGKDANTFNYRVTVTKQNSIRFPADVVTIFELEGKFVKFFVDPNKKAIAWNIIEGKTELPELNKARKFLINGKNGVCVFGIKKLLQTIKVDLATIRPDLEVKKYKDGLIGENLHYIELN